MKCSECPNQIPEMRLSIWPHAKTCSKLCSALRSANRHRSAARKYEADKLKLAKEVNQ